MTDNQRRPVMLTTDQIDWLLTVTGVMLENYAERWGSMSELERRTADLVADIDNALFASGSPTHSWAERWDQVRDRTLRMVVDNDATP